MEGPALESCRALPVSVGRRSRPPLEEEEEDRGGHEVHTEENPLLAISAANRHASDVTVPEAPTHSAFHSAGALAQNGGAAACPLQDSPETDAARRKGNRRSITDVLDLSLPASVLQPQPSLSIPPLPPRATMPDLREARAPYQSEGQEMGELLQHASLQALDSELLLLPESQQLLFQLEALRGHQQRQQGGLGAPRLSEPVCKGYAAPLVAPPVTSGLQTPSLSVIREQLSVEVQEQQQQEQQLLQTALKQPQMSLPALLQQLHQQHNQQQQQEQLQLQQAAQTGGPKPQFQQPFTLPNHTPGGQEELRAVLHHPRASVPAMPVSNPDPNTCALLPSQQCLLLQALRNAPPLATSSAKPPRALVTSAQASEYGNMGSSPTAPPPTAVLQTPLPSAADPFAASAASPASTAPAAAAAAAADGPSSSMHASASSSPFAPSPGPPRGTATSSMAPGAAVGRSVGSSSGRGPSQVGVAQPAGVASAAAAMLPQPSMEARMLEPQASGVDPIDVPSLLPDALLSSHSLDLDKGTAQAVAAMAAAVSAAVPNGPPFARAPPQEAGQPHTSTSGQAGLAAAGGQPASKPGADTQNTGKAATQPCQAAPADSLAGKKETVASTTAAPAPPAAAAEPGAAAPNAQSTEGQEQPVVSTQQRQQQQQQQEAEQDKQQQGAGVEQEHTPPFGASAPAVGAGIAPAHSHEKGTEGGSGGGAAGRANATGAGGGTEGERDAMEDAAGLQQVQKDCRQEQQEQQQQQVGPQEDQSQASTGGEAGGAKEDAPSPTIPLACTEPCSNGSSTTSAPDTSADSRMSGPPAQPHAPKSEPAAAAAAAAASAAAVSDHSSEHGKSAGVALLKQQQAEQDGATTGGSTTRAGAAEIAAGAAAVLHTPGTAEEVGQQHGGTRQAIPTSAETAHGSQGEHQQGMVLEEPVREAGQQHGSAAGVVEARKRATHACQQPSSRARHTQGWVAAVRATTGADPRRGSQQQQSVDDAGGGVGARQAALEAAPPKQQQQCQGCDPGAAASRTSEMTEIKSEMSDTPGAVASMPGAVASPPPSPVVPQAVSAGGDAGHAVRKLPATDGSTHAAQAEGGEGAGQWLSSSSSSKSSESSGTQAGAPQPQQQQQQQQPQQQQQQQQPQQQQQQQQVAQAVTVPEKAQNGHAGDGAWFSDDRPSPFAVPLSQASLSSPQPSFRADGAETENGDAGKTSYQQPRQQQQQQQQQQQRHQQHILQAPSAPAARGGPPHPPRHIPAFAYEQQQHQQQEQQLQHRQSYLLSPSPSHHVPPPPPPPHHQRHQLQQQPSVHHPILVSHPTFPCYYAVAYEPEGEVQQQQHSHQGPGLPMQLSDAPQFLYSADASISTGNFGGPGVSQTHASSGVDSMGMQALDSMGMQAHPLQQDLPLQQYPPTSNPHPMLVNTAFEADGSHQRYQLEGALNASHMHTLGAQDLGGYLDMNSVMTGPAANTAQPTYYVVGDGAQQVLVQVSPSGQVSAVGGGEGLLEQHVAVQQVVLQQQQQEQQLVMRMEAQQQHAQQLQVAIQEGVHEGALQQVQAEVRLQQLRVQVDELEAQVMDARRRHTAMQGQKQSVSSAPLANTAATVAALPNTAAAVAPTVVNTGVASQPISATAAAAAAAAASEGTGPLHGLAAQSGDGSLNGVQASVVGGNHAQQLTQAPLPTSTAKTSPTQAGTTPSVTASTPPIISSTDMMLGGALSAPQNPPLPSSASLAGVTASAADPRGTTRGGVTTLRAQPLAVSAPSHTTPALTPAAPVPPPASLGPSLGGPSHPLAHPPSPAASITPKVGSSSTAQAATTTFTPAPPTPRQPPPPPGPPSMHSPTANNSSSGYRAGPAPRNNALRGNINTPLYATPAPPPTGAPAAAAVASGPLAAAAVVNSPRNGPSLTPPSALPQHPSHFPTRPAPAVTPPQPPLATNLPPLRFNRPVAGSEGSSGGGGGVGVVEGMGSGYYPSPAAPPPAGWATSTGSAPRTLPQYHQPPSYPPPGPHIPSANSAAVTSGLHSVARILSGPGHGPRPSTNGAPYPPANSRHGPGPSMSHNYASYQQPYPPQQPHPQGLRGGVDQPYQVRRHQGGPFRTMQHSREVSPYRSEGTRSSSRRTSDSGGVCMEPTSPTSKLSWCHVQHSKKQMPAMSPMEVKELVKMQLQTRKPIRAPWYRGAGSVTPASEGGAPPGGSMQARPNAPPPKTGTGFYIPPGLAAQLDTN